MTTDNHIKRVYKELHFVLRNRRITREFRKILEETHDGKSGGTNRPGLYFKTNLAEYYRDEPPDNFARRFVKLLNKYNPDRDNFAIEVSKSRGNYELASLLE